MNKVLIFLLVLSIILVGCTAKEQAVVDRIDTVPRGEVIPEPFIEESLEYIGDVKEFSMTAEKWEFVPNTIKVSVGEAVKLTIISVDVSHGISIPELGISEVLSPGDETVIEFVADTPGTFKFFCSVYCGSGHGAMTGEIIVE